MNKMFEAHICSNENKYLLTIEDGGGVGYYLIVYPENSTVSIADYLQDTVELAKSFASEMYPGIPIKWESV